MMLKRLWHKIFGHPNVSELTCPTCGKLGSGGDDVRSDGPPSRPDDFLWRR